MKYLKYNEAIKLHSKDELNKKLQEFKEILMLNLEDVIDIYDIDWDTEHVTKIDNTYANDFAIRFKITGVHNNEELSKCMNDWIIYVEGDDWANKSESEDNRLYNKAIDMHYVYLKAYLDKISRKYDIRIQFTKSDTSIIHESSRRGSFNSKFMIYYNKRKAKFKE